MKDKFKTNPFAKSYKSDLTQECNCANLKDGDIVHINDKKECVVCGFVPQSYIDTEDHKHTGFPVMFFSKVSYGLFFLAVGMIIGSLI